jgi:surface protein
MADHRVNDSIIKAGEVHDEVEKSRGVRDTITKSARIDYVPSAMVTVWKTTSASEEIRLPLRDGWESYDFTVDWGDGNTDTVTAWDDPSKNHTYASAGTYTVRIEGTIEGFTFGSIGHSRDKILEVKRWGPFSFGGGVNQFRLCRELDITAPDAPDLSSTTSLLRAFQSSSVVGNDAFNTWDVSTIDEMGFCFINASSFNADISNWDVSNVESMNRCFENAENFNADISGWDTSSLKDARRLLYGGDAFDHSLGGWDITNLTQEPSFFFYQTGLSVQSYSDTLIGWASQNVATGFFMDARPNKYNAAAASARDTLINTYNWTIDDGGQV